jgi:CHAD domain-containing protein/CYTH domain-containing protein
MKPPTVSDLLDRVPEEAVRRLALARVEEAAGAAERLADPADAEALHDFRVALRRLRTLLRAYRPWLKGTVPRSLRRRLRNLVRGTGAGRDAEVELEWVRSLRRGLAPEERAGAEDFERRVAAQVEVAYRGLRGSLARRYARLVSALRPRLERYRRIFPIDSPVAPEAFAGVAAARIRDQFAALAEDVAAVEGIEDDGRAHRARIQGKRLRYLLEPFAAEIPAAARAVATLKRLQDLLGWLHDFAVLAGHLREAAASAAGDAAGPHRGPGRTAGTLTPNERLAGLLGLVDRLRDRKTALFARIRRDWINGPGLRRLGTHVAALAADLDRHKPPVEVERKFLLDRFPPELARRPFIDVEQGWIPGARLQERLRRTRRRNTVAFTRCIKLGSGLVRTELEEPTTEAVFRRLWPLTRGLRVLKRRYRVPQDGLVWEIDRFVDRDLVLAEVELPAVDVEPRLPDWLARCVVREVTGDPDYVNRNLAR